MNESDIQKIRLLTVNTQVNDLIILLGSMDKESLQMAVKLTKGTSHNLFSHTLEYRNKIDVELRKTDVNKADQFSFKFYEQEPTPDN